MGLRGCLQQQEKSLRAGVMEDHLEDSFLERNRDNLPQPPSSEEETESHKPEVCHQLT